MIITGKYGITNLKVNIILDYHVLQTQEWLQYQIFTVMFELTSLPNDHYSPAQ